MGTIILNLGDLGLARSYHSPLQSLYSSDKVVVTIWYRSPDLLLGARHYTPSVDIWSVGCIMGELLYLRPMFKGDEAKHDPHSKKGGSGVPFQKDQLQKIFDTLGLATSLVPLFYSIIIVRPDVVLWLLIVFGRGRLAFDRTFTRISTPRPI